VRLAAWLEGAAGVDKTRVAEPIARHYARALESTPALAREPAPGLDRDACRRRAAAWFERAAEAALELAAHEGARDLLGRSLALTGADEAVERTRRLTVLGEVTAASADMDEGARVLEEALELARAAGDRAGIARAAASLSWVLDQQVQFMPAARMAEAALDEIGERDDLETGLLLVRRGIAISNGSDAVDEPLADAERALAIARACGDRHLELDALDLRLGLGRSEPDAWLQLETVAAELGAWQRVLDAMHERALRLVPDHAAGARPIAEGVVELAEARGLREGLAWAHYLGVELGLVSGEWDEAVASARRALDIGVASGYDRAVVRTWSAVLPIAAARDDAELLDAGYVWLTQRFREPESPSPYAKIMLAARQLEIASRGLREPFFPDVEERLESFRLRYSSPSWLAALEAVVNAWLDAGELDGAGRALDRLETSAADPAMATLGRSAYRLLRAKWLAASGEDASAEATHALAGFREVRAPWWTAKALRVAGDTTEAAEIERSLGVRSP
jgi:tetratricopeptide (TPR) repeat protein